jgi:hypothetical protein
MHRTRSGDDKTARADSSLGTGHFLQRTSLLAFLATEL